MTKEERDELIDDYAWKCVFDMDLAEVRAWVAQDITNNLTNKTDAEVLASIKENYPDHPLNT